MTTGTRAHAPCQRPRPGQQQGNGHGRGLTTAQNSLSGLLPRTLAPAAAAALAPPVTWMLGPACSRRLL
eukprot:7353967-Lingulodinium_polyedra.AAC.1